MKKLLLLTLITSLSLMGWTFHQKIDLEEKTHETVHELGHVIENSSQTLAQAMTNMTEKGVYSVPWNVDENVWRNMRELTYLIAFVSFGWVLLFFGSLSLRRNLMFITQPSTLVILQKIVSSLCSIALGIVIIVSAYPLARLLSLFLI